MPHDKRCAEHGERETLMFVCSRCGHLRDASAAWDALVELAQNIDGWGEHDVHQLATEFAKRRNPAWDGDDPNGDDYARALVYAVTDGKVV